MSKIKRNDPCICGSDKKYKICCGASIIGRVDLQSVNIQLDHLQQQFISFSTDHYQQQIDEKMNVYKSSTLNQFEEVYKIGLTFWLLLHVRFIQGESLFNIFYNNFKSQLDLLPKNIVSQWASKEPSVFEVLFVNKKSKRLKVKEIVTGQTYEVPFNKNEEFIIGSIIIGILVPYAALHNFFYGMVHLKHYDLQKIRELMQMHTKNDGLIQNFPSFLRDTLLLNNTQHDEVAQLFTNHMADKNMNEDMISSGVSLWNHYCEEVSPTYQKIEPFAAALDYLVQKLYIPDATVTQAQLAKEYAISPGTVSSNYRKLVNGLKDYHDDVKQL